MSSNAIQDYVVAATKGRDELLSIQSKIPRDAVDGIVDETPLRETAGVVHRLQDQATKSADSGSTPSHHALYTAVEVLGDKWEQFVESVLDAFPEDSTTRIIDAELELNQAIVNVHSRIPLKSDKPRPRRRNRKATTTPSLTVRQVEAVRLHGDCEGNIAEVARRMGIGRKTAEEHIRKGYKVLGKDVPEKASTRSIPSDNRGQANLSAKDDKRR